MRTPYLDHEQVYAAQRCCACGHRFLVGDTSPALLRRIYASQFHDSAQQAADLETANLRREGIRFPVVGNAVRRVRWMHDQGMGGRVLDVGAGRGYFVQAAGRFFDAEGIEISESATAHARRIGARVSQGDFLAESYLPVPFDVITLWDVLAGLPNPRDAVKKLHMLLLPGGRLVMTVPYVDSMVARMTGRFWPLLIPPVNLDYYSQRSLQLLLQSEGFSIDQIKCHGKSVSVQFLAVKLARTFRVYGAEKYAAVLPRTWKVPVNLFDILTVVATKRQ